MSRDPADSSSSIVVAWPSPFVASGLLMFAAEDEVAEEDEEEEEG